MKLAALFVAFSAVSMAQNYTARTASQQGISVIHLADAAKGVEVSVVPSLGNRVTEMKVHGKNILYFPVTDLAELKSKPASERYSVSGAVGESSGRRKLLGQR